jgi:hypothetical protein
MGAYMDMITSSPALVVMEVIDISNGIVMFLDLLLVDSTHVKTSRIPEANAPIWTNSLFP